MNNNLTPQNSTTQSNGVIVRTAPVVAGATVQPNGNQSPGAMVDALGGVKNNSIPAGTTATTTPVSPQAPIADTPGTQTNGVKTTPWTTGQPLSDTQKQTLTQAGYTFDTQGNPVAPTTGTVSSASQPNIEQGVNSVLDASGNSYSTTSPQPTYDANTIALAAAMSTNGVTVTPAQVVAQYTNPDGSINSLDIANQLSTINGAKSTYQQEQSLQLQATASSLAANSASMTAAVNQINAQSKQAIAQASAISASSAGGQYGMGAGTTGGVAQIIQSKYDLALSQTMAYYQANAAQIDAGNAKALAGFASEFQSNLAQANKDSTAVVADLQSKTIQAQQFQFSKEQTGLEDIQTKINSADLSNVDPNATTADLQKMFPAIFAQAANVLGADGKPVLSPDDIASEIKGSGNAVTTRLAISQANLMNTEAKMYAAGIAIPGQGTSGTGTAPITPDQATQPAAYATWIAQNAGSKQLNQDATTQAAVTTLLNQSSSSIVSNLLNYATKGGGSSFVNAWGSLIDSKGFDVSDIPAVAANAGITEQTLKDGTALTLAANQTPAVRSQIVLPILYQIQQNLINDLPQGFNLGSKGSALVANMNAVNNAITQLGGDPTNPESGSAMPSSTTDIGGLGSFFSGSSSQQPPTLGQ